jgi:hypothetical protein
MILNNLRAIRVGGGGGRLLEYISLIIVWGNRINKLFKKIRKLI